MPEPVRSFLDSFSNREITILAAAAGGIVGAVAGGMVSIFTTRYTIKHGPNYEEQIDGLDEKFEALHETIGKLAETQESLRLQQEAQANEERELRVAGERRAEAARWKPNVEIVSKAEGKEQINKLTLRSNRQFFLLEVSLISQSGARIFEYPMNKPIGCSTGFGVPITHDSLNLIANSSQTFFQHSYFDACLRYRVSLETGDGSEHIGELPFRAQQVMVGNTCYFKMTG